MLLPARLLPGRSPSMVWGLTWWRRAVRATSRRTWARLASASRQGCRTWCRAWCLAWCLGGARVVPRAVVVSGGVVPGGGVSRGGDVWRGGGGAGVVPCLAPVVRAVRHRRGHDRDAEHLVRRTAPTGGERWLIAQQLAGPGVVAHGEAGGGVAAPHPVPDRPSAPGARASGAGTRPRPASPWCRRSSIAGRGGGLRLVDDRGRAEQQHGAGGAADEQGGEGVVEQPRAVGCGGCRWGKSPCWGPFVDQHTTVTDVTHVVKVPGRRRALGGPCSER